MNENQFALGVTSMARNCQAAVDLVRQQVWTLDNMERWLKAVIFQDEAFVNEAKNLLQKGLSNKWQTTK